MYYNDIVIQIYYRLKKASVGLSEPNYHMYYYSFKEKNCIQIIHLLANF